MKGFPGLLVAVTLACGVFVAACSDDKGEDSKTSSSSGGSSSGGSSSGNSSTTRTGTTECAGVTCQAGQYCDNITCEVGCLSNNNCAGDQTCKKSGSDQVGVCENNPQAKDCSAFVQKCMSCGQSEGNCTNACYESSAECLACLVNLSGCEAQGCATACAGDE